MIQPGPFITSDIGALNLISRAIPQIFELWLHLFWDSESFYSLDLLAIFKHFLLVVFFFRPIE